mmetsp:Transcript_26501/g.39012  ORF Transcript_26501/g.39012 Transcript_26501/m.39012 type:complete len:327 (+) Transcript_26501:1110-2090(+)
MMANAEISGLHDWYKFVAPNTLIKVLPGVISGIGIYVFTKVSKHMAVLPTCIIMLLALFYVTLFAMGLSVDDARQAGWINQAGKSPVWYKTWNCLQFDKVAWLALPPQTITFFSMVFVLALSSSLDVAAIELEMKRPLNYSHELKTVGVSNIISGLTGGYTGSYIFSQTIFSLRAGINSRLCGCVIALVEFLFVIAPVSLISYVPNFFFGSLLIMICVDLMYEWLWELRLRVTKAEYGLALFTFVLIQKLGVEYGILVATSVYFICSKLGFDVGNGKDLDLTGRKEESECTCQPPMASIERGAVLTSCDYGAVDSTSTKESSIHFV